jgi:hypothetical protein
MASAQMAAHVDSSTAMLLELVFAALRRDRR